MSMKTPEDMTMEEIREQLAIYNRLYYYKRRQEEGYMQKKTRFCLEVHSEEEVENNI